MHSSLTCVLSGLALVIEWCGAWTLVTQVYTEREWKKTKYAGKTKTMPEGIADVDMALEKTLVFD